MKSAGRYYRSYDAAQAANFTTKTMQFTIPNQTRVFFAVRSNYGTLTQWKLASSSTQLGGAEWQGFRGSAPVTVSWNNGYQTKDFKVWFSNIQAGSGSTRYFKVDD